MPVRELAEGLIPTNDVRREKKHSYNILKKANVGRVRISAD